MSLNRIISNYLSTFKPEEDFNLRLIKLIFALSSKLQTLELFAHKSKNLNSYSIKTTNNALNISQAICSFLKKVPTLHFKRREVLNKEEKEEILKAFFTTFTKEGKLLLSHLNNSANFTPEKTFKLCLQLKNSIGYLDNVKKDFPINGSFIHKLSQETKSLLFEHELTEKTSLSCLCLIAIINYQLKSKFQYHEKTINFSNNNTNSLIYNEKLCYLFFSLLDLNKEIYFHFNKYVNKHEGVFNFLLSHIKENHPEIIFIYKSSWGNISFLSQKYTHQIRDNVFTTCLFNKMFPYEGAFTLDVSSGSYREKRKKSF